MKMYKNYEEIPVLIKEYMLTVSEEKHIMDIPLDDINEFLFDLNKYYEMKPEAEYDGWVI